MKRKIFLVLLIFVIIYVYKITDQNIFIPDSSIRLRVIPNSNNPEDINIKEQVKKYLENLLLIWKKALMKIIKMKKKIK
jgi:biopolymer transport protein ExbD